MRAKRLRVAHATHQLGMMLVGDNLKPIKGTIRQQGFCSFQRN